MVVSTSSNQNIGNPDVVTNGNVETLFQGKYTLASIDVDTTGRRLIDEIVQLAAYTPKEHFEQYIMPYMNLNPAARQRHQVRVISIGFYRMLKSMQTYKIIKSKSEIAALKDFLDWLEKLNAKDADSQGIILVYYEERKFIPYMILESLKKYNLLDRFLNIVKFFINGVNLAKANTNESLHHCPLRKLAKILNGQTGDSISADCDDANAVAAADDDNKRYLQDRDVFDGSASVRAKLAYEVAQLLSNQCGGKKVPLDSPEALDILLSTVQQYAQPIECDLSELQNQNKNLERQNSFRPVFILYFKSTLYHRVRAVKFRIILAEQGYDLQSMNAIWKDKQKNGIAEVLKDIEELKGDDKLELAELFDSYFDPTKTTLKPLVRNNRRRNRRGMVPNNTKNDGNDGNTARASSEQGAGGDKSQNNASAATEMADSTTKSPNLANNFRKQQRGRRNIRARNAHPNPLRSKKPIVGQASVATPNNPPAASTNAAPAPVLAVN